ncbi:MAG: N-formylglutamate deformylase [Micavibrio sp.]|nr:MAG: N-formylglutamate deformylase [Micavibrio sp.]
MKTYQFYQGRVPLLISVPHAGTFVPPDVKRRMTDAALKLPDTDWHQEKIYYDIHKELGASLLAATHSRYVVDLNRAPDDTELYPGKLKTGLVPMETFEGEKIYQQGEEPDHIEKANRVTAYWHPYHDALQGELERMRREFGIAILYDGHSIASTVPRLFDGVLPDLNLGTANGESCAEALEQCFYAALEKQSYSTVLNGRFVGGYITRNYGNPAQNIHALQMELTWKNYMQQEVWPYHYAEDKAKKLGAALQESLAALIRFATEEFSRNVRPLARG